MVPGSLIVLVCMSPEGDLLTSGLLSFDRAPDEPPAEFILLMKVLVKDSLLKQNVMCDGTVTLKSLCKIKHIS